MRKNFTDARMRIKLVVFEKYCDVHDFEASGVENFPAQMGKLWCQ